MGTVYEAIKKSGQDGPARPSVSARGGESRKHRIVLTAAEIEAELKNISSILGERDDTVKGSAFTAHTANASDGTALPTGKASRAAGATLDAARPARAKSFVAYDVAVARVEPHLVAITQPRSAYCEQFRSLRTRILQAGERGQKRTFVITSPGMGEGKTLTALNLGWLLAQTQGIRALVIDSDLRQPCATDYLAIDAPRGLSEILGGELTLREAIVRLDPAGLYLLPGGQARDDVAELLSGPTYAAVIAEARRMFDFIIIDAPPLGIFTDANVLIDRADAALMVVRAGKTRYALVDRLLQDLPSERMLGVVLNRADQELEPSAYYYRERHYRSEPNPSPEEKLRLVKEDQPEVAIAS